MKNLEMLDNLVIEPLSDEALEIVAGGSSSDGKSCCSCSCCSNGKEAASLGTGVGDTIDSPCDGDG